MVSEMENQKKDENGIHTTANADNMNRKYWRTIQTWLQRFELNNIASVKATKPNVINCVLFLDIAGEKAIEIFKALNFTEWKKGYCEVLVWKFHEHIEGKKMI